MPEVLTVNAQVAIPLDELRFAFVRSGGPGGQNVNKVASKVELRWTPATSAALSTDDRAWLLTKLGGKLTTDGELIITSEKTRDQLVNRADATEKLVAMVQAALIRPKPRKKTRPSRGAKERRLGEKKRRGEIKATRGKHRGD